MINDELVNFTQKILSGNHTVSTRYSHSTNNYDDDYDDHDQTEHCKTISLHLLIGKKHIILMRLKSHYYYRYSYRQHTLLAQHQQLR